MTMIRNLLAATAILAASTAAAPADPVHIEALLAPTQSIKMDFKDGTKHFVLLVRREGAATGEGILAGTTVVEHGWHDLHPPHGGDPHGYLEFTAANGDVAYIKWMVRGVVTRKEGKPKPINNGHWELVSGTGQFKDMTGVGTLWIRPASKTDRIFSLDGEIAERF